MILSKGLLIGWLQRLLLRKAMVDLQIFGVLVAQSTKWSQQILLGLKNNQYVALFQIAQEWRAPEYPDDISEELKDFMDCCFKKEPSERWNIYELLHHPFILQEEYDEEKSTINNNGLTNEDKEYLLGHKEELKEISQNSLNNLKSNARNRRTTYFK